MEKSDQNQSIADSVVTTAAAGNDFQKNPPPYLMLIADCWEHIFDYLSFKDILVMGQTCKRMNQMAGYYMREYYPQLEFDWYEGKIYFQYGCPKLCVQTDFYPIIGRLHFFNEDNALEFLSSINTFDALKTLEFRWSKLSETQHENMSTVLKNVETIHLEGCEIVGNVFGQFANFCPKLREMTVYSTANDDLLFSQYYPALESLRYCSKKNSRIDELKIFLEKHLTLKHFRIYLDLFCANRDVLIQTNIQLDLLNVVIIVLNRTTPIDEFVQLSKTLYDRKFYKTLQLSLFGDVRDDIDFEHVNHAISTLPQLKNLFIYTDLNLDLVRFTNLKELRVLDELNKSDLESLAKGLPKLEQLNVFTYETEVILQFIRHAKNLKTIKLVGGRGLDLFALNNERKKLENACQVSILAQDNVYLHSKWKSHNFKLELDLVKIVRDCDPSLLDD